MSRIEKRNRNFSYFLKRVSYGSFCHRNANRPANFLLARHVCFHRFSCDAWHDWPCLWNTSKPRTKPNEPFDFFYFLSCLWAIEIFLHSWKQRGGGFGVLQTGPCLQVYGSSETGHHNLAKGIVPSGSSESMKWGPYAQATDGLYSQVPWLKQLIFAARMDTWGRANTSENWMSSLSWWWGCFEYYIWKIQRSVSTRQWPDSGFGDASSCCFVCSFSVPHRSKQSSKHRNWVKVPVNLSNVLVFVWDVVSICFLTVSSEICVSYKVSLTTFLLDCDIPLSRSIPAPIYSKQEWTHEKSIHLHCKYVSYSITESPWSVTNALSRGMREMATTQAVWFWIWENLPKLMAWRSLLRCLECGGGSVDVCRCWEIGWICRVQ